MNHLDVIKEFRSKFVRGTPPYNMPGGFGIQEAESWIEADIEDFENWIYEKLQEEREYMLDDMKKYNDILYKDEALFFVNTFLDIYREKLKSEEGK